MQFILLDISNALFARAMLYRISIAVPPLCFFYEFGLSTFSRNVSRWICDAITILCSAYKLCNAALQAFNIRLLPLQLVIDFRIMPTAWRQKDLYLAASLITARTVLRFAVCKVSAGVAIIWL